MQYNFSTISRPKIWFNDRSNSLLSISSIIRAKTDSWSWLFSSEEQNQLMVWECSSSGARWDEFVYNKNLSIQPSITKWIIEWGHVCHVKVQGRDFVSGSVHRINKLHMTRILLEGESTNQLESASLAWFWVPSSASTSGSLSDKSSSSSGMTTLFKNVTWRAKLLVLS